MRPLNARLPNDEACLVTGGAGFIGSHLVDALVKERRPVRVFDNLSSGRRGNVPPPADLHVGDLRDAAAIERAMEGVGVVFHLAAVASVPASLEKPLDCNAVNVAGTLALLRAAGAAGVRRVVFASSTAVYGEAQPPIAEDAVPRPLSPYAASKLAGELLCATAAQHFGVETVALRFFNVYGPRQDPASPYAAVVPAFAAALLSGRPATIHGDGTQTRDFVYVGDAVAALRVSAEVPRPRRSAYNVGSGRAVSIGELAHVVARAAGVAAELDFQPARPGDVRRSWADVRAIERDFGFSASTTLEEGLRETVQAMRGATSAS
jgi:UDP-glucose 4-epimerase